MTTLDLLKIESISLVNNGINLEKIVKGYYSSDLLSFALGHIREEGFILLTVLNSVNAVAVAEVLDLSGIIFVDGVNPSEDIIKKGIELKIPLFKTNLSSADCLKEIYKYENLL